MELGYQIGAKTNWPPKNLTLLTAIVSCVVTYIEIFENTKNPEVTEPGKWEWTQKVKILDLGAINC